MFPRFNRLSNQELDELFSQEVFGPNAHLQKVFPDAHLFKNEAGHIAGMESNEGEKLEFDAPIEGKLDTVAQKVLVAMQGAVRREIGNMVDAIDTADSYLSWAAKGKINQATIVADSVGFAIYTEAAIATGDLKALAEKVSKKLFQLVHMAQDQSLEKLQRNLVNTLIVRTMYQQNVVDKLIKEEVTSTESASWTNVLRHYMDDGVKVRCGDKELEYGYEYVGSGQMLVITQLSEDCFLHHIKNFCEGRGVAAYGPAGTGKTETIKDCAKLIGVPCFVVNEAGDL